MFWGTSGREEGSRVHDDEERLCAICGEEIEGPYFRVGYLLSSHKLAVCEDCFDGRKTWMELKEGYFGDYVDQYKEMEDEVRKATRSAKTPLKG